MNEKDYLTTYKNTWCQGCGNFGIWVAMRKALAELGLDPDQVLIVYGVGCSGNGVNFTKTYAWHSLHGRAVPTAIGAKLANKDLTVIAMAGDGDGLGEGMGHFIHAIRGNADVTYIIHDNKTYALTTGQAAPTSDKGYQGKSAPEGVIEEAANPVTLALAAGTTFVARGFAGNADHLKEVFKAAITHRGFSVVDVFQPCVTFNLVNTFKWFFERLYNIDQDQTYDRSDLIRAYKESLNWGAKIPYGIFYQQERPTYGDELPQLQGPALVQRPLLVRNIDNLVKSFS